MLVVKLRRNFGQTSALAAGFDHAEGEFILAMDGDLQHDPGEIPVFLEKLEEGYDVVSGWRKERIDNFVMRRIPSRCANWLMAKLSGVDIHDFGTTFKAYRREVIHNIPLYGEMHRFIPGAGLLVRRQHLRGPHHQRESRGGQIALRHRPHVPGLLRPDDHPLSAEVHDAPTAFLRTARRAGNPGRRRAVGFSAGAEDLITHQHVMEQHGPLFVIAAVMILAGTQLLALGLLGELQVRHYHAATQRAPYTDRPPGAAADLGRIEYSAGQLSAGTVSSTVTGDAGIQPQSRKFQFAVRIIPESIRARRSRILVGA